DGSVVFGESTLSFNGAEATTLSSRLSNNFKFNKLFDAQLNVNYRAPRNTVQGKTLSITSVDLGMSRDILKGNGTLAFNIRDLFNSRKYRSEISNERSFQYSEYQRRTTTATLSFTYRLNQKKQRERGGDGDYDGDGGGEF
ncbi:MAG: outer membrane beta-barrel protein, partial [Ekhidna sp.]